MGDRVEVALVGAGAAGLSLALRLAPLCDVVLVEPPDGHPARSPERTWCSWEGTLGPVAAAVSASWPVAEVVGPAGTVTREALTHPYEMVRSRDLEQLVVAPRLRGVVERIEPVAGGSRLTGDGVDLTARWVLDSRPVPLPPGGRTRWVQHFLGWRVRAARPVFDPGVATLMDFRTPQPDRAVAFDYVLPTSPTEALVEHTGFARTTLDLAAQERGVRAHLARLGVDEYEVVGSERGVIPMLDARFAAEAAPGVWRVGTAGGATRPATGYTFATLQRQADAVAGEVRAGRPPVPPAPYRRRHLWMDSLMLEALDTGRVRAAELFPTLFAAGTPRVLRFLGGGSSLRDDLAVMRAAPVRPMVETALGRLRGR